MVLQPANLRDGDDLVWRLVWAMWRRLWNEDEITPTDALQASSLAKSTMGTYCSHYTKSALWVGYTLIDGLETEACWYPFLLWGLGYSRSFLKGAVLAMWALQEMGWLPEFVTGSVWTCAKWSTSQAVARPYGGLKEPGNFARAFPAGHSGQYTEWQSYRSPACYGWARQPR